MAKNYQELASSILKLVGGENNVSHFEHCSTRLRFTLADPEKADRTALKSVPGVMGVVGSGSQCQVVIGNDVVEVYDEIMKNAAFGNSEPAKSDKKNSGASILDFMVGVFQPLVPAIAGAGILKAFLSLFSMFGLISTEGTLYFTLMQAADAALYFLPLLVAVSMATKLKVNRLVAAAAVGALLLPKMTTAISEGLVLFGVTVQNIQYSYQIFPAILAVALLYFVEKLVTKYSPKPIRIFFVPMMCFLIVVPVTLLFLGPIGYNLGQILATAVMFLYERFGWLAVGLVAAILPPHFLKCLPVGLRAPSSFSRAPPGDF
ncbi:MAG: PTS transporter subunit EIIB [Erysipelotrichaceae bacterium]|nr:PTS transporter subunit EIIB [Erysipelotrichaceae bacterium]